MTDYRKNLMRCEGRSDSGGSAFALSGNISGFLLRNIRRYGTFFPRYYFADSQWDRSPIAFPYAVRSEGASMLGDITAADELYIITGYTDMRKSIDGLCAIVEE